ncbi:MAG: DUF4434 domain-containing protein, partial [Acidobacteriaceae bacterium]|nr:DUF4434 domain-containing protein [Acidobacteriaceae bacterium]
MFVSVLNKIATALFFVMTCSAGFAAADQPTSKLRISGTYFQLLAKHAEWSDGQWKELFESLTSIGVRSLVLQWTVLDGAALYPSGHFNAVPNAPLEKVLAAADAAHIDVLVGLVQESEYWKKIQEDPASVSAYLRKLRAKSL